MSIFNLSINFTFDVARKGGRRFQETSIAINWHACVALNLIKLYLVGNKAEIKPPLLFKLWPMDQIGNQGAKGKFEGIEK